MQFEIKMSLNETLDNLVSTFCAKSRLPCCMDPKYAIADDKNRKTNIKPKHFVPILIAVANSTSK